MPHETETRPSLPPTLMLANVPIDQALLALSNRLSEIAEQMPRLSELLCEIDCSADGRCSLSFRACR